MAGVPTRVAPPDHGYELTVVDLDPLHAAISAVGELDLAARDELAQALRQPDGAAGRGVLLDLSNVTFLDCSCLGVMVASHLGHLERHGLLLLTGVGEGLAPIFRITGLEDMFFVVPAGQDPFGSDLVAQFAGRSRVPKQRPPSRGEAHIAGPTPVQQVVAG